LYVTPQETTAALSILKVLHSDASHHFITEKMIRNQPCSHCWNAPSSETQTSISRRPHDQLTRGTSLTAVAAAIILLLLGLSARVLALSDTSQSNARAISIPSSSPSSAARNLKDKRPWHHQHSHWNNEDEKSVLISIRGGDSYSSSPSPTAEDPYIQPAVYNPQIQQSNSHNNYEDGFANYNPSPSTHMDPEHVFHESVQERVDRWRSEQMQRYQNLTPEQESNPRDEMGRAKLFTNVSKGARAMIFLFFVFRNVHLIDLADQCVTRAFSKRLIRLVLMMLFVGNLAGAVATFTSPSHSSKKRMKMILNGDKLVEVMLLGWNFIRLTVNPAVHVPREVFVASMLHSLLFLLQAQSFTRLTWDENVAPPMGPPRTQPQSSSRYNEISSPSWGEEDEREPMTMYASHSPQSSGGYSSDSTGGERSRHYY
jgi:hypothetical protein